jgi:hypothetical protein
MEAAMLIQMRWQYMQCWHYMQSAAAHLHAQSAHVEWVEAVHILLHRNG